MSDIPILDITNPATPTTADVMQKSTAFVLSFARPGTKRVVRGNQVSEKSEATENAVVVDADKKMVHVGKDIIDSPELRAIVSHDGYIRRWVASRALPSPLFKSGTFLVPDTLLQDVYEFCDEAKIDRDNNIATFIASYPAKVEEARAKLKDLFDPRQYPTAEALKGSFEMKWFVLEFGTPGKLKKISAALYARERAKAESEWADATSQIRNALRVAMVGLVEHMIDRLSSDNGVAKTFHASTIVKFNEFADLFGKRNLTGDWELAQLVEKAQKVMTGVDAASLRTDADMKQRVSEGFGDVKALLDTMVIDRPTRAMNLSDEEV